MLLLASPLLNVRVQTLGNWLVNVRREEFNVGEQDVTQAAVKTPTPTLK